MSNDTQVTDSDQATENAKVGYQVAIELWIYEGELVWSKFNVMLVANSIVLALVVVRKWEVGIGSGRSGVTP